MPIDVITAARAARLLSLRNNPGYADLLGIIQDLVQEATSKMMDFQGWDAEQISILKARAQTANELAQQIQSRINEAVYDGQDGAVPQVDQAFAGRIPGSY